MLPARVVQTALLAYMFSNNSFCALFHIGAIFRCAHTLCLSVCALVYLRNNAFPASDLGSI